MAIRQQKRPDAPHPEVHETDYGAKFIKAGTETPSGEVALIPVVEEPANPEAETPVDAAPVVEEEAKVEEPAKTAPKKGKAGRPKKK